MEGDLNAAIFNPIASTISKWKMFKFLKWMQTLHQSAWDHSSENFKRRTTFNKTTFAKNEKYKHKLDES
jgi:hypothetical protein